MDRTGLCIIGRHALYNCLEVMLKKPSNAAIVTTKVKTVCSMMQLRAKKHIVEGDASPLLSSPSFEALCPESPSYREPFWWFRTMSGRFCYHFSVLVQGRIQCSGTKNNNSWALDSRELSILYFVSGVGLMTLPTKRAIPSTQMTFNLKRAMPL